LQLGENYLMTIPQSIIQEFQLKLRLVTMIHLPGKQVPGKQLTHIVKEETIVLCGKKQITPGKF